MSFYKKNDDYRDILSLSRPEIKGHPKMDALTRAAQFSPFAALTGFNEALDETTQNWEDRISYRTIL